MYNQSPEVDDIVMCTVVSYDDGIGFNVLLNGYDHTGFLMNKELASSSSDRKKIKRSGITSFLKIGAQVPLMVLETEGAQFIMSMKDAKPEPRRLCKALYQLDTRLFALCQRLQHLTGILEADWTEAFRALELNSGLEQEIEHPLNLLSDREQDDPELPENLLTGIRDNHAKLFGIKPLTVEMDATILTLHPDGCAKVTEALCGVLPQTDDDKADDKAKADVYTDEDLYKDQTLYRILIEPVALPLFHIRVTAYLKERALEILAKISQDLKEYEFDYLETKIKT